MTERVEIKERSAEAGLAKASRKIDTSGGGTITRVTQAVSGGRHDGFKYFRPEARAPACPGWNYRSCSLQTEIESRADVDVRRAARVQSKLNSTTNKEATRPSAQTCVSNDRYWRRSGTNNGDDLFVEKN